MAGRWSHIQQRLKTAVDHSFAVERPVAQLICTLDCFLVQLAARRLFESKHSYFGRVHGMFDNHVVCIRPGRQARA